MLVFREIISEFAPPDETIIFGRWGVRGYFRIDRSSLLCVLSRRGFALVMRNRLEKVKTAVVCLTFLNQPTKRIFASSLPPTIISSTL